MNSPRRARRPVEALAGVIAVCMLLSGCADSGYQYLEDRPNGVYFKVPDDWRVFGKEQVISAYLPSLTGPEEDRFRYLALTDAYPNSPEAHGLWDGPHPSALVSVRLLGQEFLPPTGETERSTLSLTAMRQLYVPVRDQDRVDLVSRQTIVKPKGTHGERSLYTVIRPDDDTRFTVEEIALVDPAITTLYTFTIGCKTSCFVENRAAIREVVDSWTVEES